VRDVGITKRQGLHATTTDSTATSTTTGTSFPAGTTKAKGTKVKFQEMLREF